MATDDRRLENRVRQKLAREGFRLCKSRTTGGYMIVDAFTNYVEAERPRQVKGNS